MKIVIYNNNREVLDVIDRVNKPEPISLTEVRWESGGATFTENYVILEDLQNFEDLTDAELLEKRKYMAKLTLARKYLDKEASYLANGTENDERTRFEGNRTRINDATNEEEMQMALNEY